MKSKNVSKMAIASLACFAFALAPTSMAHAAPSYSQGEDVVEVDVTIYEDGTILETEDDAIQTYADTSTELSNGTLQLRSNNCNYVRVSYVKRSGNPVTFRLGWSSGGTERTGGLHSNVSSGQTVSSTWNQTSVPGNILGFMTVDGQGRFQTPSVSCN
ncbi:hypothetical protein [Nocardiopsis valliformis]|uniref:hypothetical protein n=1 Tax=Nocardiopsis valliformis TaxID=239974 RepID=UPI001EF9E3DF|nr:hypothetical protein [Nocardiopsis valliformis]